MEPSPTPLSDAEVIEIKATLFKGKFTQKELASLFSVSQATISRIARGALHPSAPWPDGSTGALPARYSRKRFQETTNMRQKPAPTEPSENAIEEEVRQHIERALASEDTPVSDDDLMNVALRPSRVDPSDNGE